MAAFRHRGLVVLELAPAQVPVELRERSREVLRRAVGTPDSRDLEVLREVDLGRPLDVSAHEDVEPAVEVIVEESRTGTPSIILDSSLSGHIRESSISSYCDKAHWAQSS
jgi:hypothetical protein